MRPKSPPMHNGPTNAPMEYERLNMQYTCAKPNPGVAFTTSAKSCVIGAESPMSNTPVNVTDAIKAARLPLMLSKPKNGVPRIREMMIGHFAPYLSAKCPASGLEINDGATAAMKMRAAPLELKPYRFFTSMVIPVSNRPLNANANTKVIPQSVQHLEFFNKEKIARDDEGTLGVSAY